MSSDHQPLSSNRDYDAVIRWGDCEIGSSDLIDLSGPTVTVDPVCGRPLTHSLSPPTANARSIDSIASVYVTFSGDGRAAAVINGCIDSRDQS